MGNVHYVGAEPLTFERIEEILTGKRIMRPAYRAVTIRGEYVPIEARTPQLLPEA